jgi:hypothetical protein
MKAHLIISGFALLIAAPALAHAQPASSHAGHSAQQAPPSNQHGSGGAGAAQDHSGHQMMANPMAGGKPMDEKCSCCEKMKASENKQGSRNKPS